MDNYLDTSADLAAIEETAAAFGKRIQNLNTLVKEKRDALYDARRSDFDRAGVVETNADGRRTIDKDRQANERAFLERAINAELHEFRDNLNESSKDEREAMLRKLAERGERLTQLAAVFPNATAWLAQSGLGSQERANLQATLAGAGKAELASLAQQAQLSGNRVLAAAVVTANERLERRDRPFKSLEYAQEFVGAEHQEFLAAIKDAQDKVKAATELNNLFTRGDETPAAKIERGLRQRAAQRRNAA